MRNEDVNIYRLHVFTVNVMASFINCFSFTGGKPPKTGKSSVQDGSSINIYKPAVQE